MGESESGSGKNRLVSRPSNLNGKMSYQSDVVTVALTDPTIPVDFPEVPHDQYGLEPGYQANPL